jgi:hypothetical protein
VFAVDDGIGCRDPFALGTCAVVAEHGNGGVAGRKSFALGTGPINESVFVAQSNTAGRTSFVVSCFASSSSFLFALLSAPFPNPSASNCLRSPGFVSCCSPVVSVAVVTAVGAAAAMVVVSTTCDLTGPGAVVTTTCRASILRSGGLVVVVS